MGHFKIDEKDLFFILREQLNYAGLCDLPRYRELDGETLDLVVTEALRFAREVVQPLQETGERWGVVFENGVVRCAPEFRRAYRLCGEKGWIAVARDPAYGGQCLPHMMRIVVNDLMYGAAQSFNMAPSLTHGAGHLIETFASEELKTRYVPRMYGGQWAGTMCLTEAGAGSDLGLIRTLAVPEGDHYRIRGTKIFVSWGEHDLTENIVHLLLARTPGAPEGTRGLSLFIVPKIRVLPDGALGEPNDVHCTGVERKLGLHASPTCVLSFGEQDGCLGYLCGGINQGLAHMFQMMNQARINTGVSAMTLAGTAYRNALDYARERVQGRDLTGSGAVPIIRHPDVRRMLLWMKAVVDGMRSLIYTAAFWADLALETEAGAGREHYQVLVDFTTPIVKAYCSEMGFRVCETAIQCLGGYGFCREYPVEQYLRDVKIMSLYEGTNGIQALDLMGRKMRMQQGDAFKGFMAELEDFCRRQADGTGIEQSVRALAETAGRLKEVSLEMAHRAVSDPRQWASYAYPALLCFGDVAVTWRLLDLARAAERLMESAGHQPFLEGKVVQANYFAGVTLPVTRARLDTCIRSGREVVDMPEAGF